MATKPKASAQKVKQLANLPNGRGVIFGLVMLLIVLSMALPARTLLQQQLEIAKLERENALTAAEVAALREQVTRWNDQAYVISQARTRLNLVMPGEIAYVVLDPEEAGADAVKTKFVSAEDIESHPWYANLWQSVVIAGIGDAPLGQTIPTKITPETEKDQ
jgi:cell division protein FtsB